MSRPIEYEVNEVAKAFDEYINNNEEPLIQEFCLNYGMSRPNLYVMKEKYKEIEEAMDKCLTKQEIYILRNAQRINPALAIFRLKQPTFGYKDRQEIENTVTVKEDKLDDILRAMK